MRSNTTSAMAKTAILSSIMFTSPRSAQSGQVGIIIILIMVVLLTFGISLASRSTREIALSQQEEESNRVFNAAEAGVEQALSTSLNFTGDVYQPAPSVVPGSNASVDYSIRKQYTLNSRILEGTTVVVQLNDGAGNSAGTVNIDWSKDSNCGAPGRKPASLSVSVYGITGGVSTARHFTYAACNRNDSIPVAGGGQNGYFKRASVPTQGTDILMRIKPVYNDTELNVSATGNLPVQLYDIRSEATNQNGNETRAIQVKRTRAAAPSILDFAVLSGADLNK